MAVSIKNNGQVSRYRFATATADFCFCTVCGVLTHLTCEIDDVLQGLVNLNTLDNRPAEFAGAPVMSYEGEDYQARMQRRKDNWIARVTVT